MNKAAKGRSDFLNKTDAGTLPAFTVMTGTISTDGNRLIGDGTLFTEELVEGGWIYDSLSGELRQIKSINDDTIAVLERAFTVNIIAGSALNYIKCGLYSEVSLLVIGASDAKITGTTGNQTDLPYNVPVVLEAETVDPIAYDATGTNLFIQTLQ